MKNIKTKILTSIALLLTTLIVGCGPSKPTLNIYTWSDYIDMDLVEQFEEEYNCKVVIDTFDSNEAMYTKLKQGATGYDIIMPTSYMAKNMQEQDMLEPLDLSKIPNVKHIDKRYLNKLAFDKKMQYSIPYMLGYTCVAYNKAKLGEIEKTWNVFARDDKMVKGKMTLLNDMRETIGIGNMFNGNKMNASDDEALEKAKQQIIKWKKNLAKFDSEAYKMGITSEEFLIVQGYSGDLLQVVDDEANKGKLDIMIPREGVSISCDDIVIPKTSKNKDLAYKFINFINDPKNAAKNMEFTCFYAPNEEAKKLAKNVNFARVFPEELYDKGQLIEEKEKRKFEKVWDAIKNSK